MSYRHLPAQKRDATGRVKKYQNLRQFNAECPSRGVRGNLCELTNIRALKGGGALRRSRRSLASLVPSPAVYGCCTSLTSA